jgi:hypothetical protein
MMRRLSIGRAVFAVLRSSPGELHTILSLVNVTPIEQHLEISLQEHVSEVGAWTDLVSGGRHQTRDRLLCLTLQPYDVAWMKADV